MKRKLEPIDMFCETVLSEGKVRGMTGGLFSIYNVADECIISRRMAVELAREAWLYKQFYLKANRMSNLVDSQARGFRVAPVIMQQSKDEYVQARDKCLRLQVNSNYANVEVEDGTTDNH
jgi:hypothetical protein